VPVIPRAEMLAELMRLRQGIAIAGAHGKTSTTSMVALVLERAGLDPTAVIGGRLSAFGSNARLGRGEYVVAEADESDGSFLKLSPLVAVITNIDREHLDHYGTFDAVRQAFVDFANKVPFYGAVIACADDAELSMLLPRITRRVVTYGLDAPADISGHAVRLEAFGARCQVVRRVPGRDEADVLGDLHLRVPGRHNLLNALATVSVGLELGLPFERITSALGEFLGAERRFQLLGEVDGVMVVDDYGHHPTEIEAVLAAARAGLDRRLLVVFQPHRYTRTAQLLEEFGRALSMADEVVLTDIYAAGEEAIPGVTVEAVADAVRHVSAKRVHVVRPLEALPGAVAALARPGDMVITLGAGSIGSAGERILAELGARSRSKETTP
jgi:UDP-N-acetylmuramate--alanine ligase